MSKSRTSKDRLQAVERRLLVLEARKAGYSYQQIADQLGISKGTVCKDLTRVLAEYHARTAEEVERLRALETERLDHMLRGIWPRATSGHLGAIERALKIMERRAKLLGLDGPIKIAPTDPGGTEPYEPPTDDDEIARRIAALLDRARARRDRAAAGPAGSGDAGP